ncbi:hypothetical protein Taro_004619 [Colocasia esculenta]|uniref:Uncharacterized protein n=1 Tax=Colocasia esculenta TaxID=4460 RepID=A0A843TS52_COLES|nr:hypothetical protein [Colocasia esculenta]
MHRTLRPPPVIGSAEAIVRKELNGFLKSHKCFFKSESMSPSASSVATCAVLRQHAAPPCCTPGCHPCRPVAPGITRPCPVGLRLCCVAFLLAPANCAFPPPRPPPLAVAVLLAVSNAPAPQRADLSPFAWPPPPSPFSAAVAAHISAAVLAAPAALTPAAVQVCPHRVARRDHPGPLLLSSRRGSLLPPI